MLEYRMRRKFNVRAVQWNGTQDALTAIRALAGDNVRGGMTKALTLHCEGSARPVKVKLGNWVARDGMDGVWCIGEGHFAEFYEVESFGGEVL